MANATLKEFLYFCLGRGISLDEYVVLLHTLKDKFNLVPFVSSLFSVGFVIVSFASIQHIQALNPYLLREYFPVGRFLIAVINLLTSIAYFSVVSLGALQTLFVVALSAVCLAAPAYLYLFHTSETLSLLMGRMLLETLGMKYLRFKVMLFKTRWIRRIFKSIFEQARIIDKCISNEGHIPPAIIKKISHREYASAIYHVSRWQHTLMHNKETFLVEKNARHHARAFYTIFQHYNDRAHFLDDKEAKDLAFCLGYFALLHMDDKKLEIHRMYLRYFVNEFVVKNRNQFRENKQYERLFLSGLIVCRFYQLCRPNQDEYIDSITKWSEECESLLGTLTGQAAVKCDVLACFWGIGTYAATFIADEDKLFSTFVSIMQNPFLAGQDVFLNKNDTSATYELLTAKLLLTLHYRDELGLGPYSDEAKIASRVFNSIKEFIDNKAKEGGTKYEFPEK